MKIKLLFLLCIIIAALYCVYRVHHEPYPSTAKLADTPTFSQVNLEFVHEYKSGVSLPFLGSAIIDTNNDNVPEVFIGGGYLQRDALFIFREGGFVDISGELGLSKNIGDSTYGAAVIDADNNGYSDLFVARDSGLYLYLNNQQGFFIRQQLDIKLADGSLPLSVALGDINQDGFVDLFVSCFLRPELLRGQVFNDPEYGASSVLLLNNGDNTFTDITQSAGLNYQHNTFTALFADLDADRLPDLVVAYNTGNVRTYKNKGDNTFVNVFNPTSEYYAYPMGIAASDYNNDGRLDLFFTNIGTTIPHFLAKGDLRPDQTLHSKWILLRNDGGFQFTDVAEEARLANYEFAWGPVFADFNLDGLQDLIVADNYIKFLPQLVYRNPGRLLLQDEQNVFSAVEEDARVVNRRFGISTLVADFNQDGYKDIVQINLNGPAIANINNGGNKNYIKVALSNTAATLGAKVTVESMGDKQQTQYVLSGQGLASDSTHVLTFGLGNTTAMVDRVRVEYLSGKVLTVEKPAINQIIEFKDIAAELIPLPAQSEDDPDEIDLPTATSDALVPEEKPIPTVQPSTLEDELEKLLAE